VNHPNVNAFVVTNGTAFPVIISGNGHMSLGTSDVSSDFRLDVGGKIRACEVRVMNPGWCDYVFDPEYSLMPLSELKKFLSVNRHLPEIPAEADVEANGFDLAHMNALLLKKVEELTLYVIDLNEQLEILRSTKE
jgi:hypothetical protein